MDSSNVLELMKGFTYERFNMGKFIFKEGDKSNNKFYIIISGKVGIIIP
jgi:CRP-like cAMP-binding protein